MGRCIFCAIVLGELPAHEVFRDDQFVAFLDASPLFHGHVLVVPRAHCVTLFDLPDELDGGLARVVKRLGRAVLAGLGADGVFVANNNLVSQSVAHLHVHVIPRRKKDGLRGFFWPRQPYRDDEQAAEVAAKIRAALAASP